MFILRAIGRAVGYVFNLPTSPSYQIPKSKGKLNEEATKYFDLVTEYNTACSNQEQNFTDLQSSQIKSLLAGALGVKLQRINTQRETISKLDGGLGFLTHVDTYYPLSPSSSTATVPPKPKEAVISLDKTLRSPVKPTRGCSVFGLFSSLWRKKSDDPIVSNAVANVASVANFGRRH